MRSRTTRWLALAGTAALLAGTHPGVSAAEPDDSLSPRAERQIDALAAAKAARTPTEQKVDSTLLAAARLSAGRSLTGDASAEPRMRSTASKRADVEIRGTASPTVLARVSSLGGRVTYRSLKNQVVRADVPLGAVTSLAALPEVDRVVSLAAQPLTATMRDPRDRRPDKARASDQRRQRIASALAASRRSAAAGRAQAATGAVVSEGDRAHGADLARTQRRVSGVGVTVGVLSDGVDSLPASVASGDLPADVEVLPGAAGLGDEGTAMLEIVHDLAPKARLVFATAFSGEQSFADNIRALRAAGADVIVDDVLYFGESPFQDGPIARAVRAVTRDGAVYFSSAGNEGNVDDATSGNYEGDFDGSGRTVGKYAGEAHDFAPGADVQISDPVAASAAGPPTTLQWADPLGAAADDYDLYALDQEGNVVAFSNDTQDGDDDPFESLALPDSGGPVRLVVVKFKGADRYFQLSVFGGRFTDDGAARAYATPGVTRGHSTAPGAVSVAAVPAAGPLPFDLQPGDPANPTGPFPGRYGEDQVSERFTSDGPRRVFFRPGGAPLTPGDLSSTGGQVRRRPNLAAADGVSTSVPDYSPFFGTSASAPHAAAMAALALSGHPGLTPAALRRAMTRTAIDIEAPGRDRDTGTGIVDATALLAAVGVSGQSYATAGEPVVTASSDGDLFLEPGETGTVSLPVTSAGDVTAAGVRVDLRTASSGVTVRPASRSYGSIPADETRQRVFEVTLADTVPLGSKVALSAVVRFQGALSPQSAQDSLVVGQPAATEVTSSYAGPAVAIPDESDVGASVPLTVGGVGPVSSVRFSIDGTACSAAESSTTVGLDHTFVGDLVGTLTSPDGSTVTLFDRIAGDGANLCQTEFTDSADRSIQDVEETEAPFTGSWRPAQPLAAFGGVAGDGTWRFTAKDAVLADTGSIRAVSVHVRGFAPPPP